MTISIAETSDELALLELEGLAIFVHCKFIDVVDDSLIFEYKDGSRFQLPNIFGNIIPMAKSHCYVLELITMSDYNIIYDTTDKVLAMKSVI